MMQDNDLISRAELIQRIDKCVEESYVVTDPLMTIHDIKALISILPTVDATPERQGYVRVTRCKNCKRWEYDLDLATIGKGTCLNSLLWTEPNDYCSRGERTDSPTCGPDYCEIGGGDDERGTQDGKMIEHELRPVQADIDDAYFEYGRKHRDSKTRSEAGTNEI